MGLIKGLLIYKYTRRRANEKRDLQDAREQEAAQQEMLSGCWSKAIAELEPVLSEQAQFEVGSSIGMDVFLA